MTNPQPSNPARRPDAMCGATCRDGHQCTQYAVKGTNRCRMHGGSAPQVRAKARQNVLEARINGELQRREITPVTDPVTAIQDVVGREFAFLDLAQDRMAEISESWVRENRITGSDDAKATVAIYTAALDRAERGATRMVQLGIQARIAAAQEMRAAAFIASYQQAITLARTTDRDPVDIINTVLEEDQ
ncbi:HGGxSTG domain-containing protein [Cutibacterium avidum]|uniref:HGGxSTG domain-containing protein n=1 Tax=Cutibacterium avidum TaxID=33010 RepID=UPI0020953637|nr:HGGxSTG domain-containing protein [Cutibacterium avidum]MCO6633029.1 hypothetical protein [Cutibacterium avidum]MDQ9075660.1 HGGxSTG domain-containing protein [Cutibacterium avidum]MDU4679066.1 HGGxSTG domain-containing protein [Cutibacterium avidum]MDU5547341.1 HGGxSTG domain-containing protein [Cutibacterium avidum]